MRLILVLGLVLGFLFPAASAYAEPASILVCHPDEPVDQEDAEAAIAAMLRVVERVGQWPEHSFHGRFSTRTAECRQLLAEKRPGFAILSLGLYLEQRHEHNLVPLAQPLVKGGSTERYRVVVQQGKYQSLEELRGKTLGGTVLEEPVFVSRVVFAGSPDPADFFVLKPTRRLLRALRALDSGELDAVLLNGAQFDRLASMPLSKSVQAVFTSDELPLMGLAADKRRSTAKERSRFTEALVGLCADEEGRKLCQLFGVEAFVPADPAAFEPMIKLWNRRR